MQGEDFVLHIFILTGERNPIFLSISYEIKVLFVKVKSIYFVFSLEKNRSHQTTKH